LNGRAVWVAGAGLLLLAAVTAADIFQGQGDIPSATVVDALLAPQSTLDHEIVRGLRLPRAAAGIVAGLAMAGSAVLLQGVTRNHLAEPGTLGLTAGGTLAVTVFTAFASLQEGVPTIAIAFVGVLLGAALIGVLAVGAGAGPVRLILAGLAVSLSLSAVSASIMLVRETQTAGLFFWGAGSLIQLDWAAVRAGALVLVPCLLAAFALGRALDVQALGEATAKALGQRARMTMLGAGLVAALLAAVGVAVVGPVAFVGLFAALVARLGRPQTTAGLLAVALPWGAAILVAADVLGRLVLGTDDEIAAGIICTLLGAPALVIVARRITGAEGFGTDRAAAAVRWRTWPIVIAVGGLLAAAVLTMTVGELSASPREIADALFGHGTAAAELAVELRFPRLAVAALAGALLAAGGTILQGTVRNPLASPELVGVTGGASVGAFVILLAIPSAPDAALPFAAFGGAMVALMLALLLSAGGTYSPARVALIGLAITAACTAITTLMVLEAEPEAAVAVTWLAGSTYAASFADLRLLAIPAAVLLPAALLAARTLEIHALGDRVATGLGQRVTSARVALLVLGAALCASAVAVAGAISFVGLLAPHAARLVAGPRYSRLLPVAMLLGALLLVASDLLARELFAPVDLPVGIVVSIVGTLYLAVLMLRSRSLA